jgi:hypothetical protein
MDTIPVLVADEHEGIRGTERAIGKWRIRSHSTRGFKCWRGLEAAFRLCSEALP